MAEGTPPRTPRPEEGAGATSRLLGELLAQGRPVAEIAVRLGISVADAHARIARAAGATPATPARPLAAPPPTPSADAPSAEAAAPRPPISPSAPPTSAAPPPRRISRRALLALGVAGVAGLATGGTFLARREGGAPEALTRPPRSVPVPPTLTPVPPPLAALQPAAGVFRELTPAAGAPLDERHGIFFLRTRGEGAGSIAGWRLTEADGAAAPVYRASDGGRFIAAGAALHDRASGRSWVWPGERLQLIGLSDEAALFEIVDPERAADLVKRGRYVLTDASLEAVAEFELPGTALPAIPPFFQPGGRRAYLALEQPQAHPALFMLDGATGRTASVFAPRGQRPLQRVLFHATTPADDGESFFLPYSYWPTRPPLPLGYGVFATFVARIGWAGEHRELTRVRVDRAFVSPDGSRVAGERVFPVPGSNPIAYEETSTVLVIDGVTGRNLFRIRSARLNYGDELGGARWLADSSALVVQTRIAGKAGYSLVSADGSRLESLPEPPSEARAWYHHPDVRGAAPSPTDPALIAFGRTDLYDRAADRWLGFDPREAAPAHLGPWTERGGEEAVLALPHRPHRAFPLLADLEETSIEHNLPSEAEDG